MQLKCCVATLRQAIILSSASPVSESAGCAEIDLRPAHLHDFILDVVLSSVVKHVQASFKTQLAEKCWVNEVSTTGYSNRCTSILGVHV